MSEANLALSKPRYMSVNRHPGGTFDGKHRPLMCDNHDDVRATWTGKRRPVARIMVKDFAMCDECWKRRME